MLRLAAIFLACATLWPIMALAQVPGSGTGPSTGVPVLRSPILVIDFETLFARSAFGARVLQQIEEEGRALIAENDRIEAELTAEELLLSSQRADLAPEDFSALADAFDEKVQRIRAEQDEKARNVGQGRVAEERRFRQLVSPILGQIMQEAGALVVLERQDALVWVDVIDVTERVLAQVNRVVGAGETGPVPEGEAEPVPGIAPVPDADAAVEPDTDGSPTSRGDTAPVAD